MVVVKVMVAMAVAAMAAGVVKVVVIEVVVVAGVVIVGVEIVVVVVVVVAISILPPVEKCGTPTHGIGYFNYCNTNTRSENLLGKRSRVRKTADVVENWRLNWLLGPGDVTYVEAVGGARGARGKGGGRAADLGGG